MKVFLGGTCNGSTWRNKLISMLKIDYFNPVVEDWTPECQQEELVQRDLCDICLYVITPKMHGFYSIAEVVDDSNKRPEKTVLCILDEDASNEDEGSLIFDDHQMKSLKAVGDMVLRNKGALFYNLNELAKYLNGI